MVRCAPRFRLILGSKVSIGNSRSGLLQHVYSYDIITASSRLVSCLNAVTQFVRPKSPQSFAPFVHHNDGFDHRAAQYRNARKYFSCGKLRHFTHQCSSRLSHSPPISIFVPLLISHLPLSTPPPPVLSSNPLSPILPTSPPLFSKPPSSPILPPSSILPTSLISSQPPIYQWLLILAELCVL
jgi:hypothetical protein